MIDTPEKQSIISGIGISRIGRRTGTPALDLTIESSRAAIADAGLTPADIDAEINAHRREQATPEAQ